MSKVWSQIQKMTGNYSSHSPSTLMGEEQPMLNHMISLNSLQHIIFPLVEQNCQDFSQTTHYLNVN